MPLSNSVIRRYTPPTCTLVILAQSSPLSRWTGKTVLKQLSFELRFDDPQLPEENRIPIRGDRDQLEALCDAVTSYVQEFLHQTPEKFLLSFSGPQDSSKVTSDSVLTDFQQSPLPATTKTLNSVSSQIPPTKIHLESGNYLTHNLFLGSLAHQTSNSVISLSLLQLFDLATALEEYSADVMALPNLNNSTSSYSWPAWTSVAAVLALGVGLLPVTWQYVNHTRPKQQIAKKTVPESQQVASQPSPPLNLPTPPGGLTPANTFPPIPNLAQTPPSTTSSLPTPPLKAPNTKAPNTNAPNTTVLSTPSLTTPLASALSKTSQPSSGTPGSVITIPSKTNPTLAKTAPSVTSTTVNDQEIAIPPNLKPNPPVAISPNGVAVPIKRNLLPSLSPSTTITPPPTIPNPALAELPVNPPLLGSQLNSQLNAASNASSVATDDNSLVSKLRSARKSAPSTEVATNSTLFDTPLVTEAREYLQKRWEPPSGLKETLEYSLLVGINGTLERILPLNKPARDYVETAGIPNIGQPFISPNKSGKTLRIRAVFSPNGKVQVLPENE